MIIVGAILKKTAITKCVRLIGKQRLQGRIFYGGDFFMGTMRTQQQCLVAEKFFYDATTNTFRFQDHEKRYLGLQLSCFTKKACSPNPTRPYHLLGLGG